MTNSKVRVHGPVVAFSDVNALTLTVRVQPASRSSNSQRRFRESPKEWMQPCVRLWEFVGFVRLDRVSNLSLASNPH